MKLSGLEEEEEEEDFEMPHPLKNGHATSMLNVISAGKDSSNTKSLVNVRM